MYRLSYYSVGVSSGYRVERVIYRLPESVSRMSYYSDGILSDCRVSKINWLSAVGVGVPSVLLFSGFIV